jgi:hypothetical protein
MIGDTAQHVGKPSLRIDAFEFRRADQGVHCSRSLTATVRRDLIMPGVWAASWRSPIRFTHYSGDLRSWSPISSTTAAGI